MVDLANRCVFGKQQLVSFAHFGDIAHQQQTTRHCASRQDRHTTAKQRDIGNLLELFDHRLSSIECLPNSAVVESQFGQPHSYRIGADAHAVQRRNRIWRGIANARIFVEDHDAIADPRCRAGVANLSVKRKGTLGDHRHESLEDAHVGALEFAGLAAGSVGPLAGQHGDRLSAKPDRDRHHPRWFG